jgi:hypothetical protein
MWETIVSFVEEQWVGLMTTGGLTMASVKWFVLDKINFAKKESDVVNFKSKINDVGQDVKVVSKVLYEKFEDLQDNFEKQSVKIEAITKENVMLSNLVVQTLSVASIPVEAKEKFFNSMMETVKINEEVKQSFKVILDKQKENQEKIQDNIQETASKLDGV